MRRSLFAIALLLTVPLTAADFAATFTGATLRLDLVHSGNANEEHFSLIRSRIDGDWAGSPSQLIDDTNRGLYLLEVADLDTNRLLYSRGYASIFGEWQTTADAGERFGAFEEAVRFPEPHRVAQVRIRKRLPRRGFVEVWSTVIDPTSRFVDRPPFATADSWAVFGNGPAATKLDLLFLGDGYTAAERDLFRADVERLSGALFAVEPYARRKADFNVRALFTPSASSGVSQPRAGVFRDSPIGTRYNTFDSERYVLSLDERQWRDAAAGVPYDFVVILVNSRQYGGGGIYQLYSTAAARSAFAPYLLIHELGHHLAALADEYYTSDVAYQAPTERDEPWEPNVTAETDASRLKWRHLLSPGIEAPTPWDKEGYEEASQAIQQRRRELRAAGAPEEELEALFRDEQSAMTVRLGGEGHAGQVGLFEGASYEAKGLYRAQTDCIMFSRDEVGFCAVCQEAIERIIDLYSR